jgi:ribosomal protein L7/L12
MRPSWPRPYVHTAGTINVDVVAELVRLNQKAATLTKMLATAREPAELVTISGNIRDPEKRIMAISMVRAVAGLMLGEARDLCEGTPTKVRVDRADILRMSAFVSHCALDITTHE